MVHCVLKKINTMLLVISLVFLLLIFANYLLHAIIVMSFPYELEQSEGTQLNNVIRLYNGENIYSDINTYPFILTGYTPLYHTLTAFLIPVFGRSFIGGRLLSLLSSLGIGFVIYNILLKRTGSKLVGFISAMLFYSYKPVYTFGSLHRVDILGLFFSILGIYFMIDYKGKKSFFAAVVSFTLALYTKQSFVAAALASFIYLLSRDKKTSIRFILLYVLLAGGLFLIINYVTEMQFYNHITFMKSGGLNLSQGINRFYSTFLSQLYPLTIIGLIYTYKNRNDLPSIYFMLTLLSVISVGKPGAWINYFIEPFITTILLFGLFLGQIKSNDNELLLSFILLLIIYLLVVPLNVFELYSLSPQNNPWRHKKSFDIVSNEIQKVDGDVLTEYASFSINNNKTVLISALTLFFNQKEFNSTTLHNDCVNQRFDLIIVEDKGWLKSFVNNCLGHAYIEDKRIPGSQLYGSKNLVWIIYKPKRDW